MKQFYVYLTTNLINNKKYIGQHYGEINDSYLGSGHIILDAIKKYGKENFKKEILKICKDYEDLNNRILIKKLKDDDITNKLINNMIELLEELEKSYKDNIKIIRR